MQRNNPGLSRALIVISLMLNVALASGIVVLYWQAAGVASQNEEFAKQLYAIKQEHDLTLGQLSYYKAQAEYYSNLLRMEKANQGFGGYATINMVAVSMRDETNYEGVTMRAEVELRKGEGRILINTQPRIGIDLQTSARTGAIVAEKFTGIPLQLTDVILTVKAEKEVEVVDGPSAGAAITMALIAAIQNKTISQSVYMTGTINPDGTIGRVGGIPEKALAAAKKGATDFLVPQGQSIVTILKPEKYQPAPGIILYFYKQQRIDLQEYLKEQGYSIKVSEVAKAQEIYQIAVK